MSLLRLAVIKEHTPNPTHPFKLTSIAYFSTNVDFFSIRVCCSKISLVLLSGEYWEEKVEHCNNLMHWMPFELMNEARDSTNLYYRGNRNMKTYACHGDRHCVDKAPLFAILGKWLMCYYIDILVFNLIKITHKLYLIPSSQNYTVLVFNKLPTMAKLKLLCLLRFLNFTSPFISMYFVSYST